MVEPVIIGTIGILSPYFSASIKRRLCYLFFYKRKIRNLTTEVEKLKSRFGGVQQSVDSSKRNGDGIKEDVSLWMTQTTMIIKNAEMFLQEEMEGEGRRSTCLLCVFCPNPHSRCRLGKMATELTDLIVRAYADGSFNTVSFRPPPPRIPNSSVDGYEEFESRMFPLNQVMEVLVDPNIDMIGIHGMGGIGKTMLVKEIAMKAENQMLFSKVVMATVTQKQDLNKIRGEIASKMGLRFTSEEIESERAARLWEEIKKHEKILLILDDLWGQIDLKEIGIPFKDDHKGCKILLTSRERDVLSNDMNANKIIPLGVLPQLESLHLFKKLVGANSLDDNNNDPEFQPTTTLDVANECAGLPVAIVTVAKALKGKNPSYWRAALRELRKPIHGSVRGMKKEVYSCLELSYKNLVDDKARLLFLLCGLLDNKVRIKELMKFVMGLDLFEGVYNIGDVSDKLNSSVRDLIAASLLLDGESEEIDMHDVMRDFATYKASNEEKAFVVNGLEKWPHEDILTNAVWVSFHNCNVRELPPVLKSPSIKLLSIHVNNGFYTEIPDGFFSETPKLEVLDLDGLCISSLPSSISLLKNLRTLRLCNCKLRNIDKIGELMSLEALTLSDKEIVELPRELGRLSKLKLLDLSGCSNLKVIPFGVLSSMYNLEDLSVPQSFSNLWGTNGVDGRNNDASNASLDELKCLSHLVALEISVADFKFFPKDLFLNELIRYKVHVGPVPPKYVEYQKASRALVLQLSSKLCPEDAMQLLLEEADDLCLTELNGVKSLHDIECSLTGFPKMKHFTVLNSSEIRYIIDSTTTRAIGNVVFPKLELLTLYNLSCLEEIFHGDVPKSSFGSLQIVKVDTCKELKYLLSSSDVIRGVSKLKEIEISHCDELTEVVTRDVWDPETEGMDWMRLPHLQSLQLNHLSSLTTFSSPRKNTVSKSTSDSRKGSRMSFFNDQVILSSLDYLEFFELPQLEDIWGKSQHPIKSFMNLKELKVSWCDGLLGLIPSNLLPFLYSLKVLSVFNCSRLEQVFDLEGLHDCNNGQRLLSQLMDLKLHRLPGLKCIWNRAPRGILCFQKLVSLCVISCDNLRNVLTTSMAHSLVNLQVLQVEYCRKMEEIITNDGDGSVIDEHKTIRFPLLNSIQLTSLPNLTSFHPNNLTLDCPSLRELNIIKCPRTKTFGSISFGKVKHLYPASTHGEMKDFPNLETLILAGTNHNKWYCQLPKQTACNIKHLTLRNFEDDSTTFPFQFVQTLTSLETLTVRLSLFSKLFSSREEEKGLETLGRPDLQILKTLEVSNCDKLITLLPSSAIFHNLTTLQVSRCKGLLNLMTPSTARHLVQMTTMTIRDCKMIQEIIACEDEETVDDVVFFKLKRLELENLPRIHCFSVGNCTLMFPSLDEVIVSKCPNMFNFSLGRLGTPKLRGVVIKDRKNNKQQWSGDLNHTLRYQAFERIKSWFAVPFTMVLLYVIPHIDICLESWSMEVVTRVYSIWGEYMRENYDPLNLICGVLALRERARQ